MIPILISFAAGAAFHHLAGMENSTFDQIFRRCINEQRMPYQEELKRYVNAFGTERLTQMALIAEITVPLALCLLSGSSFGALYLAFTAGLLVCSIVKDSQRSDASRLWDGVSNLGSNIYTAFVH